MGVAESPSIVILGAGLAGLAAALELSDRGLRVTVLERGPTCGGRARSWRDDQGFWLGATSHTLPGWHLNARALLSRLNQLQSLRDHPGSAVFSRGRRLSRHSSFSLPGPLQSLTRRFGYYPGYGTRERISTQMLAMVLASYHSDRLELLDEISLRAWGVGFNASIHPFLRHMLEPFTLLNLTAPGHDISARTASAATRRQIDRPQPFVSSFRESIQAALIDPLVRLLEDRGVSIRTSTPVTGLEAGRSRLLAVHSGGQRFEASYIISALPPERLQPLLTPELLRFHYFRDLTRLRSQPLASIQLHFQVKVLDLLEPLIYSDSELGLYCQDITPPGSGGTVLSCVLMRYESFTALSDADLIRHVVRELQVVFPQIRPEWLQRFTLQRNEDAPCLLHVTGSWRLRPRTRSPFSNFLLAGDWVRHPVDMACLEGALVSGKLAANAVLEDLGIAPAEVLDAVDPASVRTLSASADLLEWPRRAVRRALARADRRKSQRIERALDGLLEDVETHVGWSQVLILNLSARGLFFVSEASPRVGARVRIRVRTHRGEQIDLRARVVRVEEVRALHEAGGIGVGCKVRPLDDESEALWEQLTLLD